MFYSIIYTRSAIFKYYTSPYKFKTAIDKLNGILVKLELRVTAHAKTTIMGILFEMNYKTKYHYSNTTSTRAHPRLKANKSKSNKTIFVP